MEISWKYQKLNKKNSHQPDWNIMMTLMMIDGSDDDEEYHEVDNDQDVGWKVLVPFSHCWFCCFWKGFFAHYPLSSSWESRGMRGGGVLHWTIHMSFVFGFYDDDEDDNNVDIDSDHEESWDHDDEKYFEVSTDVMDDDSLKMVMFVQFWFLFRTSLVLMLLKRLMGFFCTLYTLSSCCFLFSFDHEEYHGNGYDGWWWW